MLRALVIGVCLLTAPVSGEVDSVFQPSSGYEGHWGVDFAVSPGTEVRAAADGSVSFAGSVAGMRTVTIDHGHGAKTSVSHLLGISVVEGQQVEAGEVLGVSGFPHGEPGVHFSVRVGGAYVDPETFLDCLGGTIRLLPDR